MVYNQNEMTVQPRRERAMDVIPSKLMQAEVRGVNLRPGTLAEQLGERPVLLVFLRHFG